MRLTENQQPQCSAAPAPLQRSVARALAATAHYVDSVDTRQTSGTWTPPTLCCWMEAPLYINLPISIASHCHCAARHGPAYANTAGRGRSAVGGVVAGRGVWESGAPSEINSTLLPPLPLPTPQGRLVLCYPTGVALNN